MNTYKILIIKNRYKGMVNIATYIDWFKKFTPIEIVSETITTDFDVTTMKMSNETFSGVACGPDIIQKLQSIVPEGKYNSVVFLL